MQMGARRLHSCLEVIAAKVRARKYESREPTQRQIREQQAIEDAKNAATIQEDEDDGADKLMLEMYRKDAAKFRRENERLETELSKMQHRAADAEATLEAQQKYADDQLNATQKLLDSMQQLLDQTRDDATREHEQKMQINELLRGEMDRVVELQARIAELENDTRAQAEIERCGAASRSV